MERVLLEYARIGFSDMRKFTTWGPDGVTLKDGADISDDDAAAISEVSQTTTEGGGSIKFKLHDKKGALDSIGRNLGMFTDKVEVAINGSLADRLEALRKRRHGG